MADIMYWYQSIWAKPDCHQVAQKVCWIEKGSSVTVKVSCRKNRLTFYKRKCEIPHVSQTKTLITCNSKVLLLYQQIQHKPKVKMLISFKSPKTKNTEVLLHCAIVYLNTILSNICILLFQIQGTKPSPLNIFLFPLWLLQGQWESHYISLPWNTYQ